MNESVMYSTICAECFNDIPVAYGDCPYCKIAAHEQQRLIVDGDNKESLWSINGEDAPFPHEILNRKRTSAALSLFFGAALSSLILVLSMSTPPDSFDSPQDWPGWAVTDEAPGQVPKWLNETGVTLKEASSHHPPQQTTR